MNDWQNWATGLSVAAAVGYLIWHSRSFWSTSGRSDGSCGHCPQRSSSEPDRQLKVLPLVTLDPQPPQVDR